MSLATAVTTAIEKIDALMNLVRGQYDKWDGEVKAKIAELQTWKDTQVVSFSANKFYWSSTPNVVFPSVLKADTVESNRGDAYDSSTGIFTAPSDGSYLFAATVFASTVNGKNADGSKPDFDNERKWRDDMQFNINRYDKDKEILGDGTGADKIGEMWIGQLATLVESNDIPKWGRFGASSTAIHYLKAGDKVCIEFVIWNAAAKGDQMMVSFNFSGTKLH